jgi:hypothetical protein
MRRICIETSERGSKSDVTVPESLGLDTFSPNYRRKHSTSAYVFQKSVNIFMNHPDFWAKSDIPSMVDCFWERVGIKGKGPFG